MASRPRTPITVPDNPAYLAYAAGILDGEGNITIAKALDRRKGAVSPSHHVKVTIVNTDPRVMSWLFTRLGGLVGLRKRRVATWRPTYEWVLTGQNADRFLHALNRKRWLLE